MKVYIVLYVTDTYEEILSGVFSSEEKAEGYISRTNEEQNYYTIEAIVDRFDESADSL